MRNKILALLLIVSVAFNIYLLVSMNQIKITVENKTTEVDSLSASIKEKEDKLSNIDTEFTNVQTQLNELAEQKEILDTDISNNKDKLIEVLGGDDVLEDQKINQNISPLAGTVSLHNWTYPDDYDERGNRIEDRRGSIEQWFDEGVIDEEEYQRLLKSLELAEARENGGQTSTQSLAETLVESTQPSSGEGSTTPGGGGDPIELPVLPETVPDGRICY